MDSLYLETNSLLEHVQRGLASLERSANPSQAQQVEGHVNKQLDLISANCDRLDMLVNKEPPARRRNAKYRVDQLRYDSQHVRAALFSLQQKLTSRWQAEREHDELINRRYTPNESTSIHFGDAELDHNDRLNRTNRNLDDLISSGVSALENLRHQGLSMKGVRKKMLNFAQTLGVSNTVMRLIERRTTQDKYILFGGMIVTLIIMFLLYKLLKG